MHKYITKSTYLTSMTELTKISLVAALYMTVTIAVAPFGFGAIQFRLSEMFNYLALFNKRYIIAITLGVVFVNFLSPTWILDVPIGGIATFLVLHISLFITKPIKNNITKFVLTAIIFSISMFTVAGQLTFVLGLPFFYTWLTVGIGELLSMSLGGFAIYMVSKKIDLSR